MGRHPKPVVLEPASASLLRLGREMGSSDVPAAELVLGPLWSMAASREVDRILDDRDREEKNQLEDDMRRGMLFSRYCQSCWARCTPFGTKHVDGCDLDRTLTFGQRYQLRHPDLSPGKRFRLLAIRARWAVINGRCFRCRTNPRVDATYCQPCGDVIRERARLRYRRNVEAARAA
jgi:hypothetical protein